MYLFKHPLKCLQLLVLVLGSHRGLDADPGSMIGKDTCVPSSAPGGLTGPSLLCVHSMWN